jgi:hypothetical protein
MSDTPDVYHRTGYAQELAQQLLHPSPLFQNVRSGVFLSGIRRVGKTTFLRQDLIPALEERGAIVIYVDLWADRTQSPTALVQDAVRATLRDLSTPGASLLQRFKGLSLGAAGFSFGFQLDRLGAKGGTTLAQALEELVNTAKTDVVLIIDEVQQALATEDGYSLMHGLKAARDAVNARPDAPGHFIFLGTGSHKSLVTDMTTRRAQPFTGALAAGYQVLDQDFVNWLLQRVAASPGVKLPTAAVAWQGFQTMGHRPEELLKALVELQRISAPPNQAFPIICSTLASAAADVELHAVEEFGALGKALFSKIAAGGEQGINGLFGADALAEYGALTGSVVETNQVQTLAEKMIAANLITRLGHGVYAVADPFVRTVWLERMALSVAGAAAAKPAKPG